MAKKAVRRPKKDAERGWFARHVGEVMVSVVAGIILLVITPFIAGWLQFEKTEGGGIRVTRGSPSESPRQGTSAPAPSPAAAVRLSSEGDRADTTRLSADLEPLVRQRLRVPGALEGLTIRYRLGSLAFTGGANRRAAASWAIGLPGKTGAACPPQEISFYSTPNLAERLAEKINGGIAATEQRGEPICG